MWLSRVHNYYIPNFYNTAFLKSSISEIRPLRCFSEGLNYWSSVLVFIKHLIQPALRNAHAARQNDDSGCRAVLWVLGKKKRLLRDRERKKKAGRKVLTICGDAGKSSEGKREKERERWRMGKRSSWKDTDVESGEIQRASQGFIAEANRFSVSPMTHPLRRRSVKCISWPGASQPKLSPYLRASVRHSLLCVPVFPRPLGLSFQSRSFSPLFSPASPKEECISVVLIWQRLRIRTQCTWLIIHDTTETKRERFI